MCMADKTVEIQCLNKVLLATQPDGEDAEIIHTLLRNATVISDTKQESPDFILQSGNTVIGLEHFLIDVLITERGSNARLVLKQRKAAMKRRKHTKKTRRMINASPLVKQQLQKGIRGFTEQAFLQELHRVSKKHNRMASVYRGEMSQHPAGEYLLGAMIEMPCQTNGYFLLRNPNNTRERRLNCVPFTRNMIDIMRRTLTEFDFVVVLAETLLNENPRDAKVYCIWQHRYEEAIQQQRIPLCTSFEIIE